MKPDLNKSADVLDVIPQHVDLLNSPQCSVW